MKKQAQECYHTLCSACDKYLKTCWHTGIRFYVLCMCKTSYLQQAGKLSFPTKAYHSWVWKPNVFICKGAGVVFAVNQHCSIEITGAPLISIEKC